jgi:hypothetical protein
MYTSYPGCRASADAPALCPGLGEVAPSGRNAKSCRRGFPRSDLGGAFASNATRQGSRRESPRRALARGLAVLDFLESLDFLGALGFLESLDFLEYGAPRSAHLLEPLEKDCSLGSRLAQTLLLKRTLLGVAPRRGAPTKLLRTGGSLGKFRMEPSTRDSSSSRSPFEARNTVSTFPEPKIEARNTVSAFPENEMEASRRVSGFPENKVEARYAVSAFPENEMEASRRVSGFPENKIGARDAVSTFPENKVEAGNAVSGLSENEMEVSRRVSGFPENEMVLETLFLASRKTK